MGKRAKEHRKKVQKRNETINNEKKRMDKWRKSIIEQIMKEREMGAFDNPKELPMIEVENKDLEN